MVCGVTMLQKLAIDQAHAGMFDEAFIEERRRGLEEFINKYT